MKKFIIFFIVILFLPVLIFSQTMRDNTKTPLPVYLEHVAQVRIDTTTNAENIADNKEVIEELSAVPYVLYYTDDVSPSEGYLLMTTSIPVQAESTIVKTLDSAKIIITTFTVAESLDLPRLRAGLYHSHFHAEVDSVSKETRVRVEVWKGTGTAETFLFSTELSDLLTLDKTYFDVHISTFEILGDVGFLVVKVAAEITGTGANPDLTFYMEGDNNSNFEMPALLSDVGVTKIISGTDVIITPTSGRGDVTINSDSLPKSSGTKITENINNIATLAESTGTVNRPYALVVGFTQDCDYICDGTDDHVQVNQAIAAMPALSSGTVKLRGGAYDIDANTGVQMNIENVVLSGQGTATRFVAQNSEVGGFGVNISANNCIIENISFERGTEAGLDGHIHITGEDYIIRNCRFSMGSMHGEVVVNATNAALRGKILNNKFIVTGSEKVAISVYGSSSIISGNYFYSNDEYSIRGNDAWSGRITDNFFTHGEGIRLFGDAVRWMIYGNNFEGTTTEITDAGVETRIRNNLDKNGVWYPETSPINMKGQDLTDTNHGSFDTVLATTSITSKGSYICSDGTQFTSTEAFNTGEVDGDGNKNREYRFPAKGFAFPSVDFAQPYKEEYDLTGSTYCFYEAQYDPSSDETICEEVGMWNGAYNDGNITFYILYYTTYVDTGYIEFNVETSTAGEVNSTLPFNNNTFGLFNGSSYAYQHMTATKTISSNLPIDDAVYKMIFWEDASDSSVTGDVNVKETKIKYVVD